MPDLEDNARPVRQRQYRLNPKYSLKVKEELDTLLEAGFIYPVKHSEWVSPIVIAPKKVGADGKVKIRVCQDYRKLNEATKKDAYPLPFTDIILDHVARHVVYTFLDGMAGYYQTNIRFCDQIYTTFITDWGTYAFRRMPFGLCNAPGTFQRIIRDIFHDFMRHFLEVFIDDFVVFSKSWEGHLEHLRLTFQWCREANLKLHPGKCFIRMDSGILLGHRVFEQGIAVDLEKVTAILALIRPSNVKEVRGFLGMVGYYRRFVEGYAKLALPLTKLLKETPFQWTKRQEEAFKELKMRMVKAPMMVAPDFDKVFYVTSDASGFCVGVILWQYGEDKEERPIYYCSRQMSPAEKNYTTTERECLPIIYACKKFRHYLLGYDVVTHTDHAAIRHLVNKPDLSGRLARWIMLLQEFQYQIKVKPGLGNKNVDFLSRLEEAAAKESIRDDFPDEHLFSIAELGAEPGEPGRDPGPGPDPNPDPKPEAEPGVEPAANPEAKPEAEPVPNRESGGEEEYEEIKRYLRDGTLPSGNRYEKRMFIVKSSPYTLVQDILFKVGPDQKLRRCVNKKEALRVLHTFHSGEEGGHFGVQTTIRKIRTAWYWWPTLHKDVKKYIRSCGPCQHSGKPSVRDHWALTPIIPLGPFAKWGIDFIGPISPASRTHRNRYIILATDYGTKWVEAKATRKNDASTAGRFLFENILMRFGAPWELVSDRGLHFINETIENITYQHQITHRLTTPYNPKANGLTERANGIVCKIVSRMVSAHKSDWDQKLASAVFAYNTAEKFTTGRSPYYLVYGQHPLSIVGLELTTAGEVIPTEEMEQEGVGRIEALEEELSLI